MRQRMVVYSPVIAGRPASSAYAIPCGTSSAVRTRPATRSWRSHRGSYDHRLARPGATRAIPGAVCVDGCRTSADRRGRGIGRVAEHDHAVDEMEADPALGDPEHRTHAVRPEHLG